jgi:hypothetical protein
MQQLRTLLVPAVQAQQPVALFALGDHACTLVVSEGGEGTSTPMVHTLDLSLQHLVQHHFTNRLPSPAQLEIGIMAVEDAVMPLAQWLPPSTILVTRDALLLHIARQAVGNPQLGATHLQPGAMTPTVTREAIEALFTHLVHRLSHHGEPEVNPRDGPRWAAALLILREAMHHWNVAELKLLTP